MPFVQLPDRSVVSVSGPDAEHLLQNIITTDLDALQDGQAKAGALLTPQGKIQFDFLVSRHGENAFRFDIRRDCADDFVRRLSMYRLRAKAEIAKQDHVLVATAWGNDSDGSHNESGASETGSSWLKDTRFSQEPVFRLYGADFAAPLLSLADGSAWNRLRIANGVAESGSDYALTDAFPHDVLLDLSGGVGFSKGCYVGQEVVSRMQHRGTARRRVLIVEGDAPLPPAGTELTVDGKSVGTLGTVESRSALAICRIDKVGAALAEGKAIEAAGVAVHPRIPDWASFSYPKDEEA